KEFYIFCRIFINNESISSLQKTTMSLSYVFMRYSTKLHMVVINTYYEIAKLKGDFKYDKNSANNWLYWYRCYGEKYDKQFTFCLIQREHLHTYKRKSSISSSSRGCLETVCRITCS